MGSFCKKTPAWWICVANNLNEEQGFRGAKMHFTIAQTLVPVKNTSDVASLWNAVA